MATLTALAMLVTVAAIDSAPGEPVAAPADEVAADTVEEPEAIPEPVWGIWDALAECESTGRWHVATGNGYWGGLQEDMAFWRHYGGLEFASRPDLATREQQIAVARAGLAVEGWKAWPVCARRLGLR